MDADIGGIYIELICEMEQKSIIDAIRALYIFTIPSQIDTPSYNCIRSVDLEYLVFSYCHCQGDRSWSCVIEHKKSIVIWA